MRRGVVGVFAAQLGVGCAGDRAASSELWVEQVALPVCDAPVGEPGALADGLDGSGVVFAHREGTAPSDAEARTFQGTFGVGDAGAVDPVTIRWPDGATSAVPGLCVDCRVKLTRR